MTTTSMIGLGKIMEKNNSEAIQYSAEAQYLFPINVTTTWIALSYDVVKSRQQTHPRTEMNSTLGRHSARCAGQLVILITTVNNTHKNYHNYYSYRLGTA